MGQKFSLASVSKNFLPGLVASHAIFSNGFTEHVFRWGGVGQNEYMVGQSRSLEIFICMPKLREPMVIRSTLSFSHWNRESKTDNPVTICSLAFNSETKISSESLI